MWRGEPLFCNGSAPIDLIKCLFQDFKKWANICWVSCEINFFFNLIALWSVIQHNQKMREMEKWLPKFPCATILCLEVWWGSSIISKFCRESLVCVCIYLYIHTEHADLVWESLIGGRLWVCVQRDWDPTPAKVCISNLSSEAKNLLENQGLNI